LRRAAEGGAGAVITKTIVLNPLQQMNPRPCMARIQSGLLNTERCSEIKLEDWCRKEFRVAKEAAVPVIASVGITPEEVRVITPAVEEAGADMLELSVFIPYDDPEPLLDAVRAAKEQSSLPISVKLNANVADIAKLALAAKEEGADAFSAIDGLNAGMAVDIEAGRPVLGEQGYGRISGAAIKPLALRCVAEVAHHTGLPVIGTGGVSGGAGAVEMLMAGATAVGVCTASLLQGPDVFKKITREISEFLARKGYSSVTEVIGVALAHISFPETERVRREYELGPVKASSALAEVIAEKCIGCQLCFKTCPYASVAMRRGVAEILRSTCVGCGLCISLCPTQAIELRE